jgi:hypothetical protein
MSRDRKSGHLRPGKIDERVEQLRAYPRRFFRFAAQYAFMRWDCALGAPADLPFLRFFIARLSLSRSAMSSAMMCSVGISV